MIRSTSSLASFFKVGCVALLLGAGAASRADTVVFQDSTGKVVNTTLNVGGSSYSVDWYLPSGTASALMRFDRIGLIQTGAMLVYCAALVGLALSPSYYLALAMCSLAGAAEMVNSVNNQTMLQMSAPADMRGRVVSLIQLNPALIALGSLVAGSLGDGVGAPGACVTVASLSAALILGLLMASPHLRSLRLSQYR